MSLLGEVGFPILELIKHPRDTYQPTRLIVKLVTGEASKADAPGKADDKRMGGPG